MSKANSLKNEQELILACARKEPNAQKQLFDQYAGKMLGVCARYCPNMEDAKDALHEGYIKVFGQIERFKGNAKLETWMTRIMINTAIDHFKKSIKFKEYDPSLRELEEAVYIEFNDEKQVSIKELYALINQLPNGYRVIFSLYAIEGYTHKEIAAELEISIGTSKSQLARARKQLQLLVKKNINLG